jgi:hypothetical protein
MRRPGRRARAPRGARLVGVILCAGCAGMVPTPEGAPVEPPPPAGYGTLRQDEVSVDLVSGQLRLKVTPLDESVTRLTAPDTYRRLAALAHQHGADAAQLPGTPHPTLFLVSAFSDSPDVAFVPEELQLVSKGVRLRPSAILPVTPGWEQRRLEQRRTEMAVYAFSGDVDLESDLVVVYGLVESGEWGAIVPRLRAERARVRARAAGGSGSDPGGEPQTSSPYPAILR